MRKKKQELIQSKPGKYVYSENDVHCTEGFALAKYQLADTVRQKERKQARNAKGLVYRRIMEIIEERNVFDFFRLEKIIRCEFPELEEGFYDRANTFKGVIDSRRYANLYGLLDQSYTDIKKNYDKLLGENAELSKKLESQASELESIRLSSVRELQRKLHNKDEETKKIRSDLDSALSDKEQLQSEVDYLRKELMNLEKLYNLKRFSIEFLNKICYTVAGKVVYYD